MRNPSHLLAAVSLLAALGCSTPPDVSYQLTIDSLPGGGRIAVYGAGRGDTVIALAGGPAFGSGYLREALGPLTKGHTVLAVDLRGRGAAQPAPAESLSMSRDVADLELLRAQLGLDQLQLIGHHWGAGVAMLYAVAHPERVRRLALIGPMPVNIDEVYQLTKLRLDSAAMIRHAQAIASEEPQRDADGYCREFWGFTLSPAEESDPAAVRRLAPSICSASPTDLRERPVVSQALYASLGAWKWDDTLSAVRAPTLVMVGDRRPDRIEAARYWSTQVQDGHLLVVGRTPWFPWVEAPVAFATALDQFFAGEWPAAADQVATTPRP
jgi:pimeloyl-ACP methyl ester carboxylesterase